jgi:hypothetical protein
MTNKDLIDLVNNFQSWGGNTFTLAMQICQRQREDDAQLAESAGQQELADAIRSSQ